MGVLEKPPRKEEREERKEKREREEARERDSPRGALWRGREKDLQPSPTISLREKSAMNTDGAI